LFQQLNTTLLSKHIWLNRTCRKPEISIWFLYKNYSISQMFTASRRNVKCGQASMEVNKHICTRHQQLQ